MEASTLEVSSSKVLRRERRVVTMLVALGIAVRGAIFALQPTPMLWFDTGTYMARSLPHAAPAHDRPLGYSWFLRGLRFLDGHLWVIQAAQMLLGVFAALCLYGFARRLVSRPQWAPLMVLGLCLFWPTNLILETYVLSETLFLSIVALGAFLWIVAIQRRSLWTFALSGMALAFASLVRLPGIYFCATFGLLSIPLLARGFSRRIAASDRATLFGPVAFTIPSAFVLLAYMWLYHAHHGVWAIASWAGVNRYCMVAHLIEPELAEPDGRQVAFLRAHADGNRGGFSRVMWSERSPINLAETELGLDAPARDRWAGKLAWRAVLRHPRAATEIFVDNIIRAVTAKDGLERQIKIEPRLNVYKSTLEVYGVNALEWHTNHSFRWPWLLQLLVLEPLMLMGLFASLIFAMRPESRRGYQIIVAANALLFILVVSASIEVEQRHVHIVENLAIVNVALLGAQCWRMARVRRSIGVLKS